MIPSIQRLGIAILVAASLDITISFIRPLPSRAAFLTLPDGAKCEGQFQGSNGRGIFVYTNDDRYEGQVSNGKPNGRGMFLFANNSRYEGTISNGEPNGSGTFTFGDGDRYQGRVLNGQPHGQGTLTYANGQVYRGEVRDGKPFNPNRDEKSQ